MDMSKYFGMFISESREHLKNMNSQIIDLEKNPSNKEGIDALFREAHSLKGMAASMGFDQTARLAHYLEDYLDGFRISGTVSASAVDRLLSGADLMETLLDDIEAGRAEQDVDHFISSKALDEISLAPEEIAPEPQAQPKSALSTTDEESTETKTYLVSVGISPEATVPSARAMIIFKELAAFGRVENQVPSVEELRGGLPVRVVSAHLSTAHPPSRIEATLSGIVDVVAVSLTEPEVKEKTGGRKEEASSRTVRVRTELLDRFINLTGELVTNRSMLQSASIMEDWDAIRNGLVLLNRLINDLHYQVLQVRMLPFESVAGRLPRVVRDLARSCKKEVRFEVEGGDIELDRAILEELGDSLVHLVRNAVDHGIETSGDVRVRAWREKDLAVIEVADTGKGIDVDRIRKKALEKGLVTEAQLKTMRDRDALQLICAPGFSTASSVTETSGRGVGMDVVKTAAENLGGTLDIESVKGKGTKFQIRVPVSVAIIQILLVECRDQLIGIPITRVVRTVDIPRSEIKNSGRRLVCRVDNQLVPLLSLHKMLGMPVGASRDSLPVIITEARGRRIGLVVDRLTGQREVFVKTLRSPLNRLLGVTGASVLGDGRIVFLLDPQTILAERWKRSPDDKEKVG